MFSPIISYCYAPAKLCVIYCTTIFVWCHILFTPKRNQIQAPGCPFISVTCQKSIYEETICYLYNTTIYTFSIGSANDTDTHIYIYIYIYIYILIGQNVIKAMLVQKRNENLYSPCLGNWNTLEVCHRLCHMLTRVHLSLCASMYSERQIDKT